MKHSLRTKLSLTIALVVLLTVALISLLANFFIGNQFKGYITSQQIKTTKEIVGSISQQYDKETGTWDVDFIHSIGMYALYDGYIVKVYDLDENTIWDAETCDMNLCIDVMDDITHRMMTEYPEINGEFTSKDFPAIKDGEKIGRINISYFGPYFLSEDDFQFLKQLNKILIGIGMFSLVISIVVGFIMAKHISLPIRKTVAVTKQISDGDYFVRIKEETNTFEVEELVQSVNHLAESLEKQEALRRQLTADVAHELRTPLTTVQTHLEALIEGIWEPTTKRLQSCYDEMGRICKLVNDLEKLAKIEGESFKLNKTQVNLFNLSDKALNGFEMELINKNIKTDIRGNCPDIYADEDRINQVLVNLISNAIKYTPDGGNIWITLSETNKDVIFSIEDTGIGIPENEIPFIFERFYRADKSRNRTTGGSGIGLAIVKSIVTAHGGSVDVESRLNEGSCFMVRLPKSNYDKL